MILKRLKYFSESKKPHLDLASHIGTGFVLGGASGALIGQGLKKLGLSEKTQTAAILTGLTAGVGSGIYLAIKQYKKEREELAKNSAQESLAITTYENMSPIHKKLLKIQKDTDKYLPSKVKEDSWYSPHLECFLEPGHANFYGKGYEYGFSFGYRDEGRIFWDKTKKIWKDQDNKGKPINNLKQELLERADMYIKSVKENENYYCSGEEQPKLLNYLEHLKEEFKKL